MTAEKDPAIVFYESESGARGIIVHDEGSEVPEVLRKRFQGSHKKLVEWIENGITGGGYFTPEDVITFANPGDEFNEEFSVMSSLDIALSPIQQVYRVNRNGTITCVQSTINVLFEKVAEQ